MTWEGRPRRSRTFSNSFVPSAQTLSGQEISLFHSDQGSEYVSGAYESLLAEYGTVPSHSRKGSPWQNGYQESFYNNFKLELGDVRRFVHAGELVEAIGQQISYYNNRRIHSVLKMPPTIFRGIHQRKQLAYASR